jgi:phosphomethylpyrimidine synthase
MNSPILAGNNLIGNLKIACKKEGVDFSAAYKKFLKGEVLVTSSKRRIEPIALGEGFRPKFAVIVGTSTEEKSIKKVIVKARLACSLGASMIHEGSTVGDVDKIRRILIQEVSVPIAFSHPVGTIISAAHKNRGIKDVTEDELVERVEYDIDMGAESLVIPASATQRIVKMSLRSKRIMPCTSKCGSLIVNWMIRHKKENPYFKYIDKIFKIAKSNNTIICLLSVFRPGCIADAFDEVQREELKVIKGLVEKARKAGVQIEVGLGGHMPINRISDYYLAQKRLFRTPIISFGPQVTDTSVGCDHIDAAIGQSLALLSGADALFIITPAEHLGMPQEEDIIKGCEAARIAIHAINVSRGKDIEDDLEISKARAKGSGCSMCGEYCALKTMREVLP